MRTREPRFPNMKIQPITANGLNDIPAGVELLKNALLTKGKAFTARERAAFRLEGLLPPRQLTLEQQIERALAQFRAKTSDLEKYIFLTSLQQRNETQFFRLLIEHLEETMPIIYTPTVGQACLEYGSIFRNPRGLWISIEDRGNIGNILRNWPNRGARMIVVTDGERILGLGDLGAYGMGIPIGKLALYGACGGVHPYYCLPITLDVGTDNEKFLEDPLYIGLPRRRVRGKEYDDFLDEFIAATQEVFPSCLIQFEDFANHNAFHLLEKWKDRICCFNDDIQGTAAVALAGLMAATRETGTPLAEQTLLFYGAGEAGTGIANLFVSALVESGVDEKTARRKCWFFDSKGLLVSARGDKLAEHKVPYVQDAEHTRSLAEAVDRIRPTALIGVAGMGPAFTPEILRSMAASHKRPIIFALSNPTSKAECTAAQAYEETEGRCIYASGSPFKPVNFQGREFRPGQGNNVYIFPGVGLGALAVGASRVTDTMFLAAARSLAGQTSKNDLQSGCVYPPLHTIRDVSLNIAVKVAEEAFNKGLAGIERPDDLKKDIASRMFFPEYADYA